MTEIREASSDTTAIAVASAAAGAPVSQRKGLAALVEEAMPEIAKALPPGIMDAERFNRIILTEFRKTPRLLTCTPTSFMGALFQIAQLGLEPGGQLGHAFLIPYNTTDRRTKEEITEAQLQVGYKGFVELGGRRGILIRAREVREGDDFDFELGSNEYLHHSYKLDPDFPRVDRPVIGFYGKVVMPDGKTTFHVMDRSEINKRRDRSSAVRSGRKTPWDTDYDAMARKTVIRAMVPQIALAPELQIALKADEAVVTGRGDDLSYLYRDAIEIPTGGGTLSPADDEPTNAREVIEIQDTIPSQDEFPLPDDIPEITAAVLMDLPDEKVRAEQAGWVQAYMADNPGAVDEQVAYALGQRLASSAQEPPGAVQPPLGDDGDPGPTEPQGAAPEGVQDTWLTATERAVNAWPLDVVRTKLREWEEPTKGAEKALRARLTLRLATERQKGNKAAEDLF